MNVENWYQRVRRGGWAEDFKRYMQGKLTVPIGPRNTWSNIAYALAGIGVFLWNPEPASVVMGTGLVSLAIGSGLYHAYKTKETNNLDWAGMCATMGPLATHGVVASARPLWGFAAMSMSGIALASTLPWLPRRFDLVMGGLYVAAAVPAFIWGSTYYATIGLAAFAAAYACWHLDKKGWGKWFHAFWHVLTAEGIFATYVAR